MKTKEKILHTALRLFNEKGTENISTRHIAADMKISVGNLHYHYPTKNAVILALMGRCTQRTDALAILLEEEPPGPHNWTAVMQLTFEVILDYRFLFNDRLVLTRRIPEFEDLFKEIVARRKAEFERFLSGLREQGLLRTDLPPIQFDALFTQIIILYNSWSGHVGLLGDEESLEELPGKYAEIISRIWIPYFSERGRSVLLRN